MSHEPSIASSLLNFQFIKQKSRPSQWWKKQIFNLLKQLDGGELTIVDGDETTAFGKKTDLNAKIIVKDSSFYRRIALGGTMAVGESFLEEVWTSPNLYHLFRIFARCKSLVDNMDQSWVRFTVPLLRLSEYFAENTLKGSRKNIAHHYDLGNDFFKLFLDPSLTYSSAIFEKDNIEKHLFTASQAKLERICKMIELKKSDHIIEIGTGWGSFAIYAATQYGCKVTTTTISKDQKALAEERIKEHQCSDLVEVKLLDYRELKGQYDKLVSIEMIEAVGHNYIGTYLKKCASLIKPLGITAIQAITIPDQAYQTHLKNVDFIQKYIFPGSKIPCVSNILQQAKANTTFILSDLKDITLDYAETMVQWRQKFIENLDQVRTLGYDEKFIKMWDYYLNYCAAGFAERYLGTVQLQFRKLS